jgi:hypothetical protein
VHSPVRTEEKTGMILIRLTGPMSNCRGDLSVLRHTARFVLKQFVTADSSAHKLLCKGGKIHNTEPLLTSAKHKVTWYNPVSRRRLHKEVTMFPSLSLSPIWTAETEPHSFSTPA